MTFNKPLTNIESPLLRDTLFQPSSHSPVLRTLQMTSRIRIVLSLFLLACSVSAHADWTSYGKIHNVQIGETGIHLTLEINENPNSCASTVLYEIDKNSLFSREMLALAVEANARRMRVRIFTKQCTANGKYNLIHSIRTYVR